MLKNVVLKRALKNYVFPFLSFFNYIIPKNDTIVLLYSANKGINNSLLPLRKLMLDYSFDKKYKLYCGIENLKYADDEKRVHFISHLKSIWIYFRAKTVFYTTGMIPIKPAKSQFVIQLGHGITDLKKCGKWAKNIGNGDEHYYNYLAVSSELYIPIYSSEFDCPEEEAVPIGDVLADQLFYYSREKKYFKNYSKFLIWYPTFRKSDYLGYTDSKEGLVPMFEEKDYPIINEYLRKYNIKLIVKTHPMQDNVGIEERHFSNFDVYTHNEFIEQGFDTYELLAQSDGMIGDYSSISLHSLLIDIPLAYVIPDIEEYGQIRGFVFDNPERYMPGVKIKDKDAFYKFIDNFASGKDEYQSERHRVRDVIFKYQDGKTCERALALCGLSF